MKKLRLKKKMTARVTMDSQGRARQARRSRGGSPRKRSSRIRRES
jgi:hypothetical protein